VANNTDLVVRLRANSDDLERGFKSAEASARAFERELARLEAQQRSMAQTEAAAYREEAQRRSAQEQAIRRMANLEAQAYRDEAERQRARERAIEEVQAAERAAYAEQQRRDAAAARAAERQAAQERQRLERRRQAMGEVGAAGLAMGAALAAGLALSVRAAVQWETAWTGVAKVVDGNAAQMDVLQEQLRGLARVLPASTTEIAGVAEAAGQLGIKREDIAKFTQTMIGLGSATNLSSDEAATSLARFMNIMGTAAGDVDRLGATIVGLGNNGASTEKEITEMGLRIAGAGKTIGLTEAQVLGVANALSSVGIEAEAGGSAISTVFIKMANTVSAGGDKLEEFGQVAGMTGTQFADLFHRDAATALVDFESGLGNMVKTGGDAFGVLSDLGLTEIRQRDAVLRLANAGSVLSDSLAQGNKDWAENSALLNEVNRRYGTSASRFQIAKNGLNDMAITLGAELLPALTRGAEDVGQLAHEFAALPKPVQEGTAVVGALAVGILGIGGGAAIAAPRLAALGESLALMGARGAGVATGLSRVAGFLTGPWGIAIAAGTAVLGIFVEKHLQAKKVVDDLTEAIKQDSGAFGENARNAVAAQLAQQGLLEKAKALGLPLNVVTDAALGNASAQARLQAAVTQATQALDAQRAGGANAKVGFDQATLGAAQAQVAYEKGGAALTYYQDDLAKVVGATTDLSGKAADAKKQAELYTQAIAAAGGATDGTADSATAAGTAVTQAAGSLASAAAAADTTTDALQNLADSLGIDVDDLKKVVDATSEAAQGFVDFTDIYSTALQAKQQREQDSAEASAKAAGKTSESWKNAGDSVKLTFNEFLKSLRDAVQQQQNYESNLLTLASRVPEDFLAYISQLGPQAAQLIGDMTKQSQAKLDETVKLWRKSGKAATDGYAQQLLAAQPLLERISEVAGQKVADRYAKQLAAGETNVDAITKRWGYAVNNNIPAEKRTNIYVDGVPGATTSISSLKAAIEDLPAAKQIRVVVYDAQGNAITTAYNRNADGTVTPRIDAPGKSTKRAAGGYIAGPGTGTSDSIPARLSNGEFVIRASETAKHRDLLERINSGDPSVQHFATGGLVGSTDISVTVPDGLPAGLAQLMDGLTSAINAADQQTALAALATTMSGASTAGVQRWAGTALQALSMLGMPASYLPHVLRRMNQESGGNPRAINLWDRNATVLHDPSRGLMQTIGSTFNRYHVAGTSTDIYDPLANIAAALNYAAHAYAKRGGVLYAMDKPGGYVAGGLVAGAGGPSSDSIPAMLSNGEFVVNAAATRQHFKLLTALNGQRYATGGLVTRGDRGLVTGAGSSSVGNGVDLAGYLAANINPARVVVDDSALRRANAALVGYQSTLAAATAAMNNAQSEADRLAAAVDAAQDVFDQATRDQADAVKDQTRAYEDARDAAKDLADAEAALTNDHDLGNYRRDLAAAKTKAQRDSAQNKINERTYDLQQKINEARNKAAEADRAYAAAQDVVVDKVYAAQDAQVALADAKDASAKASSKLKTATEAQATADAAATSAANAQAAAQDALNQAKAEALAYAQKIAQAALANDDITSLFTAEDTARALKYAQAAYTAAQAQARATTDATRYQDALDQVAAAGQKLAAAQAATGASYNVQKATIAATRAEVQKLALAYGFTAQEAANLAESSVPLLNTGQSLVDQLTQQLTAVEQFSQSVNTLRTLGLSQTLLDQILQAGPQKGLAVAQEIVSGGSDIVRRLNAVQAQLTAASNALGVRASDAAFGAAAGSASIGASVTRGTRVVLKASGGYVTGPGTGTSDSIPAMLSNGEFVVKAAAVAKYGPRFLDSVNAMKFATGGLVGRQLPAAPSPVVVFVQAPAAASAPTGPAIGSVFGGPVTIEQSTDVEAAISRAKFYAGALGTAVLT
jgi:TP901 family phage tail tape measure protein